MDLQWIILQGKSINLFTNNKEISFSFKRILLIKYLLNGLVSISYFLYDGHYREKLYDYCGRIVLL